jgi:uncharacterized DUF497 family protein
VPIDFDPEKDAANIKKHGISLARAADFEDRRTVIDDRRDYGEPRYRSFGLLDGKPHCFVFTLRDGAIRPISLRRAHSREYRRYVP